MNQFAFDHRQEHHYAATMKIKKPKNKKAIPSKSTSKKSSTQEKLLASAAKKHLYTVDDILMNVRPTPMVRGVLTREEKIEKISVKFAEIMKILNLDLADDSLKDTPRRVAKMYVNEIFAGLFPENFPRISTIDNKMNYNQMIVVQEIQCLSFCEHHFLTIDGVATVAYIPEKKVIGLSKINRIVKFFSRRPQVQERLTKQIADCLQYVLETPHVAVHINAKHYCVITRGVEDSHSATSTCDLRGDFLDLPETRSEFLGHCKVRF